MWLLRPSLRFILAKTQRRKRRKEKKIENKSKEDMMVRYAGLLIMLLFYSAAMAQAPYVGAQEADFELANITSDDMDNIRGKKILFCSSFGGR